LSERIAYRSTPWHQPPLVATVFTQPGFSTQISTQTASHALERTIKCLALQGILEYFVPQADGVFQAGHAGSIPVTRSVVSGWPDRFCESVFDQPSMSLV
jgi:hypothetical protein